MDVDNDTDVKLKCLFAEGHTHSGIWLCNKVVDVSIDVVTVCLLTKSLSHWHCGVWQYANMEIGMYQWNLDASVSQYANME